MFDIQLRSSTDQDKDFLKTVYADSRALEMRRSGWPQHAIDQFLENQFELQHKQYAEHYPGAAFDLIVVDKKPVGRLYVYRTQKEIRLMDIAVLSAWRKKGIGGFLLGQLIEESEKAGLPISLHVEQDNPILPYYERLGFVKGELRGVYYYMERAPRMMAKKS